MPETVCGPDPERAVSAWLAALAPGQKGAGLLSGLHNYDPCLVACSLQCSLSDAGTELHAVSNARFSCCVSLILLSVHGNPEELKQKFLWLSLTTFCQQMRFLSTWHGIRVLNQHRRSSIFCKIFDREHPPMMTSSARSRSLLKVSGDLMAKHSWSILLRGGAVRPANMPRDTCMWGLLY